MKKSLIVSLLLPALLSLTACSLERTTVEIGFQGTAEEFESAKEAADLWNKTCHRDLIDVHLWRPGFGDVPMFGVPGKVSEENDRALAVTISHAGIPKDVDFQNDSATYKPFLVDIFAHEFGHALGLHHTKTGLMQPSCCTGVPDARVITQEECDLALKGEQ